MSNIELTAVRSSPIDDSVGSEVDNQDLVLANDLESALESLPETNTQDAQTTSSLNRLDMIIR